MRKTIAAVGACLLLSTGVAVADELSLQSAFGKTLPILGPAADRFAAEVSTLTDGKIQFKHYGAGELSPPFEILDNVGSGAIDAGWTFAGYEAGKASAADLFGSIPFGPDATKYVTWVQHGGGLELWQEIYKPFNVVPMPCGVIISEAAGWFTKEIKSPDDLKGLKFRIGGLGGAILTKLGANPMSIPTGEITTSLETGRLDGTELSFPMIDKLLGFYKVAKHYYFPGWHQPSGFIEFYINADKWKSLSDEQRTAIETACNDVNLWTIGTAVAGQQEALDEFKANGVDVARLPDSVIDALHKAADAVFADKAAADPMFKKVLDSYKAFSTAYDNYQALNRL